MIKLPKDKVIITVATTGHFATKAKNPNIPEQPDEIAELVHACYNEGAAIVHIHARDKDGKAIGDVDVFREISDKIRAKCNIILQYSTSSAPELTMDERLAPLQAQPEMAALNMGSMLRKDGTFFLNTRSDIERGAALMKEKGIKPEIELYHPGLIDELNNLIGKDLLVKPYYINCIQGTPHQGAMPASPQNLLIYLGLLPDETIFNVIGRAPAPVEIITMAMIFGGCIRVGLEDTLFDQNGELANNVDLVARAVRIARELGKEPTKPEEARQILGL